MRDIPIIFSAPMILALLAGRKTMTRRFLYTKRKARNGMIPASAPFLRDHPPPRGQLGPSGFPNDIGPDEYWTLSGWQNAKPGDRLWVRESLTPSGAYISYAADCSVIKWEGGDPPSRLWRWKQSGLPSIHMPRWASRLTLVVTAPKIERVQQISDEDCLAEGIVRFRSYDSWAYGIQCEGGYTDWGLRPHWGLSPQEALMNLWCTLHGPSTWVDNPEVVALSFTVHQTNIDAMPKAKAA